MNALYGLSEHHDIPDMQLFLGRNNERYIIITREKRVTSLMKRPAEELDDFDADERDAKVLALLADDKIPNNITPASPFNDLPLEIQEIVVSVTVGTLMTMGRISRRFAVIARNDHVWRRCFTRDFPAEFIYCNGQLPFFIVTGPKHPLYREDRDIYQDDLSPWKRFYLYMNRCYVVRAREFITTYSIYFWKLGVDPINIARAPEFPKMTSKELYRWCRRYIFGKPLVYNGLVLYDRRSRLAWSFVLLIVWLAYDRTDNPHPRFTAQDVVVAYWRIASRRHWMRPYLALAAQNAVPSRTVRFRNFGQLSTQLIATELNSPEWNTFMTTFDPTLYAAFSQDDENNYNQFLQELRIEQEPELYIFHGQPDNFRGYLEIYINRIFKSFRIGNEQPCIFTWASELMEMAKKSEFDTTEMEAWFPDFTNKIRDVSVNNEDMFDTFELQMDFRTIMQLIDDTELRPHFFDFHIDFDELHEFVGAKKATFTRLLETLSSLPVYRDSADRRILFLAKQLK
jgi:hypothetical protein